MFPHLLTEEMPMVGVFIPAVTFNVDKILHCICVFNAFVSVIFPIQVLSKDNDVAKTPRSANCNDFEKCRVVLENIEKQIRRKD